MKIKFLAVICLALAGLFGSVSTKAVNTPVVAVSQSTSSLVSELVKTFNDPEMKRTMIAQTDGIIDGVNATSSGNTVIINFSFSKAINLGDFNDQQKEALIDNFTSSFMQSGGDGLAIMKQFGVSLKFKFKDKFGHSVATTL